jgi:hypothetical protein
MPRKEFSAATIEAVPIIPKRKSITKAQRVRVFDLGGGRCYLCELPIKHGEKWEAEHPEFRAGGGSDKIRDLRPAHVNCHKPKSAIDAATLAKTNRSRANHLGIKPPKKTGLEGRAQDEKNAAKGPKRPSLPPRAMFVDDKQARKSA